MDIPVPPNTPVIRPVDINTLIPHFALDQEAAWDLVLDDKENRPPTETTPEVRARGEKYVGKIGHAL